MNQERGVSLELQRTAPVAPGEAGERKIERFIERQAKRTGADKANAEAERQREIDLKRLVAMRSENRAAWITHLRKTACVHLQIARSARNRARRLENGESA